MHPHLNPTPSPSLTSSLTTLKDVDLPTSKESPQYINDLTSEACCQHWKQVICVIHAENKEEEEKITALLTPNCISFSYNLPDLE